MSTIGQWWMWLVFFGFMLFMLSADLYLLGGNRAHRVSTREATAWVIVWVISAALFALALWIYLYYHDNLALANSKTLEFVTGYIVEKSLSIDNLFVFLMIFGYFVVPREYQRRVLLYGILGAIAMRFIFITFGILLVAQFEWILYLFGAFLVFTGVKMLLFAEAEEDLSKNLLLRWMRKHLRITAHYHGEKFFVRENHLLYVTPLFLVLVLIEVSDVIFAVDSIPAIFVITHDPFIIYTSNVFAIFGLRAMYFLLANMADRFEFLKYGVAMILMIIGVKMVLSHWIEIPTLLTLALVVVILTASVIISWKKTAGTDH